MYVHIVTIKVHVIRITNMKTCKDCKDRYVGCHSNCDDYKKYRERMEEANRLRKYNSTSVSQGWGFIRKEGRHK